MKQVIIRNIPDEVMERLQARAKRLGHSVEAMLRDVLAEFARAERETIKRRADEMATRLAGAHHTDSTILVRQERDRLRNEGAGPVPPPSRER